ncbi:hypothetical protein Tcan_15785 [Toxocara canis]|uniref:Uncharacterized protein n=1 Tax=Toxocara canis TaxID=6265 RepID=A0A0B2V9D9_TOXCA|nr:hypothetical protein Tcan_15785 [Toxocara canis]
MAHTLQLALAGGLKASGCRAEVDALIRGVVLVQYNTTFGGEVQVRYRTKKFWHDDITVSGTGPQALVKLEIPLETSQQYHEIKVGDEIRAFDWDYWHERMSPRPGQLLCS